MTTSEENKTIVELRTKLEMRTLFLRFSLALNTSLVGGLLIFILQHVYGR